MRSLAKTDIHLFPNSPEGHAVLYQLQQRAEAWAEGVSAGVWTALTIGHHDYDLFHG